MSERMPSSRVMRAVGMAVLATLSVTCGAVTVEYADGKDPAVKFAAKELERLLGSVPGRILFAEDSSMDGQQWRFRSQSDGSLEIAGRDGMGICYGAMTFLEKYAGVSWLAPDTEIVPSKIDLDIASLRLDETAKPVFVYREMYTGKDGMDGRWRLRNKETRRALHGVGVPVGSPRDCHTFDVYNAFLKKAHPEFYGKRKGRSGTICNFFCQSDEKTRDIIADELCRHIETDARKAEGKPAYLRPTFYDLSQPDGSGGFECACPKCHSLCESSGDGSTGLNIDFVNAVAERVAKRHPDVLIQTFAYGPTEKPPTNDVRYADNVVVRYCRSWIFRPLLPGSEHGKMLQEWSRHASKFGIWGYWRTFRGSLFPFVVPMKTIQDELRFCRDCGVTRYFAEDESPLSRSFAMLQHWMFLKLTEDPDQDVGALTSKFLAGYYGKAAMPIERYLRHLESVEEESRAYLDRDFFEKVNAWLDEAERLAAGDERSLRHVHWERIVVDRTMYDRLGELQKAGYRYDKEKVAARFVANVKDQIENWSGFFPNHMKAYREQRLVAAVNEGRLYSRYPVEIPEQFAGLEVEDIHWNRCMGSRSASVEDDDACAGIAFYNNRNDVHKLPYSLGFYNAQERSGDTISFETQADVPQDEKFHLYKIGRGVVVAGLYMTYDPTWENRYYANTPGIIPEEWEIWVSIKFQGPNFVKGSTKENRVLFDRLMYVKNDDPMRGYEKAGDDLLAGFKPMEVKGVNPGCKFQACRINADPRAIKDDLLVTGRVKSSGVEYGKGLSSPFVGLWAVDANGGNAFSISCANVFPGTHEWHDFAVVEASRIRRHAKKKTGPLKLTFRVSLSCQPGTVSVEDVKVVPLRKKTGEAGS